VLLLPQSLLLLILLLLVVAPHQTQAHWAEVEVQADTVLHICQKHQAAVVQQKHH
jgi:hypothetical protein